MIEQHRKKVNLLTRVPSQNLEWQQRSAEGARRAWREGVVALLTGLTLWDALFLGQQLVHPRRGQTLFAAAPAPRRLHLDPQATGAIPRTSITRSTLKG